VSYRTIALEIDARGVATLALARPEKRNAMTGQMIAELAEAAAALDADAAVRCVVLTGQGSHFCAGGDLADMQKQIAASREQRLDQARALARMLSAINDLGKPVIGRVAGGALGGGLGLVAVCDVVVTGESADFGFTETRLGLVPATIGPFVIARMGANARRVFMSGRVFKGAEAVSLGLAARAVADDQLDAAVAAEVAPYLNAAPGAVRAAKRLCRALDPPIDQATIEMAIRYLADAWESEEAQHGIESFLAKRRPRWAAG
jgi:methylglutaconyl-CoA hydratase